MDFLCRKCGSTSFYLKQKGMQVGIYCDCCGGWGKWVGKKELPYFKRQGYSILPENANVTLKNNVNLGVQQVEELKNKDISFLDNAPFGTQDMGMQSSEKHSESQEMSIDIEKEVERRVAEKLKEYGKMAKKGEKESKEEIVNDSFCPVCEGNPLKSEGESRVEVSIYSGAMTITDPEGVTILGMYRLKRCPFCGKIF